MKKTSLILPVVFLALAGTASAQAPSKAPTASGSLCGTMARRSLLRSGSLAPGASSARLYL